MRRDPRPDHRPYPHPPLEGSKLRKLAVVLAALIAFPLQPTEARQLNRCEQFHWFTGKHSPPNNEAVYRMGDCVARWLNISPGAMHCRLERESHAYPYAHRWHSRFWGPLQIGWDRTGSYRSGGTRRSDSEFEDWRNDLPRRLKVQIPHDAGPFSPKASLIIGGWHAHLAGWGAWTTCR